MNKKFYLSALALPFIMAACSSEDTLSEVQSAKDQFEGIAKVDAQFYTDNFGSRLANNWGLEDGDDIGMAWLGVPDGDNYGGTPLGIMGYAYQNHPLTGSASGTLTPQTSIYVGKYFIYHPYNEDVRHLSNVGFDVSEQPLTEDSNAPAKKSIYLSSEWTDVTMGGDINGDNKAGRDCSFEVKARQLSNLVKLGLTWKNNDELEKEIGAPIIDTVQVDYRNANGGVISATGFEYAPDAWDAEQYNEAFDTKGGHYWGNFKLETSATGIIAAPAPRALAARNIPLDVEATPVSGFKNVSQGAIDLVAEGGYTVKGKDAAFYYNALPAYNESAERIGMRVVTDYGIITYEKAMDEVAKTVDYKVEGQGYLENYDGGEDNQETEEYEAIPAEGSFMNRLFKSGKIETTIDFYDAKMNGMHVKDDDHLQKLLKFYQLKTKKDVKYAEPRVVLYLDANENGSGDFEISKKSIAMVQEINEEEAGAYNVALLTCKVPHNGKTPRIVVFNDGTDLEVPSFAKVFGEQVEVYLKDMDWTWSKPLAKAAAGYKQTGNVTTIHNLGTLDVYGDVEAGNSVLTDLFEGLINEEGAEINFVEGVASLWKVDLTNHGEINIPAGSQMRVYSDVINDVTKITGVREGKMGIINNNGVLGAVEDQNGAIYNYGKIYHNSGAKTFITENTNNEEFGEEMSADNKIGIIEMEEPDANVSVSNATNKGIITYEWDGDETYVSPAVVRYNYLIVSSNIKFTEQETEIRYIEVTGDDVYVSNKMIKNLNNLQGIIVVEGAALNITEGNKLSALQAAHVEGYVYNGGIFEYNNDVETYFGKTNKENILKYVGF